MLDDAANGTASASATTLRIAVGGKEGGNVDQHFGQADAFLIYDVDPSGRLLVESREIAAHAQGDEDRRVTIVRMLADCAMLLVVKVGEAPKAMLAGAGIEATDRYGGQPVDAALAAAYAARMA